MSDRILGSADPEAPEMSPYLSWFISQVARKDQCVVRLYEGQPTLISRPDCEDNLN